MSERNLTLLTDLYELTMMQGYFKNKTNEMVVFDAFYRKNPSGGGYAIACGLDQVIDYIKNLHFEKEDIDYLRSVGLFEEDFLDYLANFRFSGDIYAIPEGTVVFPREMGRKIGQAEEIRHASDYDDFYIASKEESERQISVADEFIILAEKYCMEQLEKQKENAF